MKENEGEVPKVRSDDGDDGDYPFSGMGLAGSAIAGDDWSMSGDVGHRWSWIRLTDMTGPVGLCPPRCAAKSPARRS